LLVHPLRERLSAQTAWLPILRALGTRPGFGQQLSVSDASKVFDGSGRMIDAGVRQRLRDYMEGFTRFVAAGLGR
jgi:chromate reductase, NAD(P)H dehydrogenase (quinone)